MFCGKSFLWQKDVPFLSLYFLWQKAGCFIIVSMARIEDYIIPSTPIQPYLSIYNNSANFTTLRQYIIHNTIKTFQPSATTIPI